MPNCIATTVIQQAMKHKIRSLDLHKEHDFRRITEGAYIGPPKERRLEFRERKVQKCNQALLQATKDKSEAQLALKKANKDFKASRKHFHAVLNAVGVSSDLLDE
jgi:hypothetical protein